MFIEDSIGTHTDILLSIDQGETWEVNLTNLPVGNYKLLNKNDAYAISHKYIHDEAYRIELTHYKDGSLFSYIKQYNSPESIYYTDLAVLTSDTAFVVINSTIYSTYNGGSDWENFGNTTKYQIFEIQKSGNKSAYMGNSLGFYSTVDGGMSWDSIYDSTFIFKIAFCNDIQGIVCQNIYKPNILLTQNGGESFKSVLGLSANEDVTDLSMPDSTTMYVAVDSAVNTYYVLKSADTGNTWDKISLSPGFEPSKMFFLNSMIGYMAGTVIINDIWRTALYRTNNGGNNWYNMFANVFVTGFPLGVKFFEDNIGYINVYYNSYDGDFQLYKKIPGELNTILTASTWLDFDFLTPDSGVVYSDNQLKFTSNGGLSWEIFGYYPGFQYVKIFSKEQIILYNYDGKILQINPSTSPGWAKTNTKVSSNQDLLIYPNPVSTHFFIKTDIPIQSPNFIKIYNLQGKLVYQEPILPSNSDIYKIDLPNLANGIYVFTVNTGKQLYQGKLIIASQ